MKLSIRIAGRLKTDIKSDHCTLEYETHTGIHNTEVRFSKDFKMEGIIKGAKVIITGEPALRRAAEDIETQYMCGAMPIGYKAKPGSGTFLILAEKVELYPATSNP